jgi:hypothetical protein
LKIQTPEHPNTISALWLKAAVAGGLWASVEIIAGSFLHNIRVPFAGGVLASFGMMLMIAFYRMWPERGLIWRAGVVCALMKSISPSAVILGPMMGILSEAILLDLSLRLLGRSFPAVVFAGGISVLAAFGQKIFNILVIYGFSLVRIYLNLFDFAARQMGYTHANPWVLIIVLAGIYFTMGMLAGIAGYVIGQRSINLKEPVRTLRLNGKRELFSGEEERQRYSTLLLFVNLLAIPGGIILINKTEILVFAPIALAYVLFCLFYYPVLWRRLKKPLLWIQLLIIIVLSVLFWQGGNRGNGILGFQGLMAGLEMSLRALLVISGFTGISSELRNPLVRAFLFRRGLRQVYGSVSLAFQALPMMLEEAVRPRELIRRPFTAVAKMLASAGKWEKAFEEAGIDEIKDAD